MWQRRKMRQRTVLPWLLASSILIAGAACSSSPIDTSPTTSPATTSPGSTTTGPQDAVLTESLHCDPLDERACLLPWPNDAFTVPDDTTPTGRRLDIRPDSTPLNAAGVPIDVTDQNRADGFSPGSAILALVPNLDVEKSGIAPSTGIGASLAADAPIVLLDTVTGERVPYWGELDAPAPKPDQLLMVHPAISLPEGHHFIVAIRHLKDAQGAEIQRSTAFQAALDNTPEPLERARHFREMLATLADADVAPDDLYLAWDFTVASAESLSGRLLHIRDLAYQAVGDDQLHFAVSSSTDTDGLRTIEGTYDVPNFLSGDGAAGNSFVLGDDGLPVQNTDHPTYQAPFRCLMPLTPAAGRTTIVFGHGLLGNRGQVDGLSFAASGGLAGVCGTDEIGMATDDLPNLAAILADLSHFNQQADRMQQGHLNQSFLGRMLNSPNGFVTSPAFQTTDGQPLLSPGTTVFVGNSQGGVIGGAASAISSEWSRVVLGVPGINYSLLLPRSSDWPEFQSIFDVAYTDPVDRVLSLQLIQLLWDCGENNGYAQHLTANPYAGIDAKRVLLVEAFGDHQVSNVSTDILSRTIGAQVYEPSLTAGRSPDVDPQWNIPALDSSADPGVVQVVWDWGTPAAPTVNLPPTEPEYGSDPHGNGGSEPRLLQQAIEFLFTGSFNDACDGKPCQGDSFSISPG